MEWFSYLPWIALVVLSVGYWSQAWKIHKQKEVGDLSMASYLCLALGFVIMGWQAHHEGSVIFLTKQLMTLVPVLMILTQIWLYRSQDAGWVECVDSDCDSQLQQTWQYCPECGTQPMEFDRRSLVLEQRGQRPVTGSPPSLGRIPMDFQMLWVPTERSPSELLTPWEERNEKKAPEQVLPSLQDASPG